MKLRIRYTIAIMTIIAILAALKCSLPTECTEESVPRYCVEN